MSKIKFSVSLTYIIFIFGSRKALSSFVLFCFLFFRFFVFFFLCLMKFVLKKT